MFTGLVEDMGVLRALAPLPHGSGQRLRIAARLLDEELHAGAEPGEARVAGQALLVAVVDLLHDHRGLEQPEAVIEHDVRQIAARALGVAGAELGVERWRHLADHRRGGGRRLKPGDVVELRLAPIRRV